MFSVCPISDETDGMVLFTFCNIRTLLFKPTQTTWKFHRMNQVIFRKVPLVMAIASLAACSTTGSSTGTESVSGITAEELQARNEALLAKEAELAKKEAELQDKEASMSSSQVASSSYQSSGMAGGDLLPPGAKEGECYARVWVEPTYKTVTDQLLVKEATTEYEIIPAKYETVEETVEVKTCSPQPSPAPSPPPGRTATKPLAPCAIGSTPPATDPSRASRIKSSGITTIPAACCKPLPASAAHQIAGATQPHPTTSA